MRSFLNELDNVRRAAILACAPALAQLPRGELEAMAVAWSEERFVAGSDIVKEGDHGDRLYLIVEGRAEVTVLGPRGPVLLAALAEGEIFGELALLSGSTRQGTVRALTALSALSLRSADFQAALKRQPQFDRALRQGQERMRLVKFLKQASPFSSLSVPQVETLARRLKRLTVDAGTEAVRQGELGSSCYLVESGRVEVVQESSRGQERRLAVLEPGSIFGEAALLSAGARTATVRALERCELLSLERQDLLEAMGASEDLARGLIETMSWRGLPRQAPGIEVHERRTAEGDIITVLKDPARAVYFSLSAGGKRLWDRLDGEHSMRDLALDYFTFCRVFAPDRVAQVVADLVAAGFAQVPRLTPDLASLAMDGRGAGRKSAKEIVIDGLDPWLSRLYRGGIRYFYTPLGQAALLLLSVVGFASFWLHNPLMWPEARHCLRDWKLWLFLAVASVASVVFHELAHAFTVKAFGREVRRMGVTWRWLIPTAFVDTSDIWLAARWPRIAVSLAGPYSQLVLAGACALALAFLAPGWPASGLWLLSLALYVTAALSLNPLLDLDGYYALMDYFDSSDLRRDAALRRREGWAYRLCTLTSLGVAAFFLAYTYNRIIH